MSPKVPFKKVEMYLGDLVQAEERLIFKEGQVIFYEGHQPYGVYVLREGRVRLFRVQRGRSEKLIRIIQPGHIFGDKECLSGEPYDCSAKAETCASVSFFSRTIFDSETKDRNTGG